MPAKKFGSQIDLQKIPVLGLVPESNASTSHPAAPIEGQLFYNTDAKRLEIYENGAWVQASNTGVELVANKGVANGYAGLDGTSKVPFANLPTGTTATTVAIGNHGHALTDANITGILPYAQLPVGTVANTVAAGNDTRFTDSRTPTGAAGGDLTGTYPNPTIANLAVTAAKIALATITDAQVAAANKDGVAGTASMRTLGTGAQQALAGNTRLDQLTAPTAAVGFNGQRATNLADPSSAQDAATKAYVDGAVSGLDIKASVRAASTANVAVTYNATGGASGRGQITAAPNALDGVTLAVGNRILLKDQTTAAQNGIWVVSTLGTGATGVWDRATDFDTDAEVTAGAFTFVEEGTVNADTGWVLTTNNPITIGGAAGTALAWSQFSGAGSITAGNGLTKAGNTISAVGTANRITVSAGGIDIASNYVGQTSITTLGTITTGVWTGTTIAVANGGTGATTPAGARTNLGATGKYANNVTSLAAGVETTITHSLGTTDVITQFRNVATGYEEMLSWRVIDANTIGVTADTAYAASALRVVVVG